MTEILWFLTRASGIVAMVLIATAIIDGLVFSGREGGRRIRPAWWLDIHRGVGGYALIFTEFHLLTAYGAGLGYSVIDLLVPGVSHQSTTAVTLGILALYAMVITVFTTWPKRLVRRGVWHALHLLSLPAALLVAIHGWQMGSDATSGWYVTLMAVLAGCVMYPVVLRITGIIRRRRADTSTGSATTSSTTTASGSTRFESTELPSSPPTGPRVLVNAVR